MKFGDFVGLSGNIMFDTYGRRTHFYLDVLELHPPGLEAIGMCILSMLSVEAHAQQIHISTLNNNPIICSPFKNLQEHGRLLTVSN